MSEIHLHSVTFSELSQITHEILVSDAPPFTSPEFLVIRYFGAYRSGGAGRPDADYIVAVATGAKRAWYSHGTILDFRELKYDWGDEMEWVSGIGYVGAIEMTEPLAIVVGDGCRKAMKSLLRNEYDKSCVNTLEQAYELCRQQEQQFKRRLRELKPSPAATPHTPHSPSAPPPDSSSPP